MRTFEAGNQSVERTRPLGEENGAVKRPAGQRGPVGTGLSCNKEHPAAQHVLCALWERPGKSLSLLNLGRNHNNLPDSEETTTNSTCAHFFTLQADITSTVSVLHVLSFTVSSWSSLPRSTGVNNFCCITSPAHGIVKKCFTGKTKIK